jgi:hypothetical protein
MSELDITHLPYTGTAKQRANLEKLASYLAALPDDYSHFEMSVFFDSEEDEFMAEPIPTPELLNRCGTVACACGHGPVAGVAVADEDMHCLDGISWLRYAERAFGLSATNPAHNWCFSGGWSCVDNTPAGAAARIRYLLAEGCPVTASNFSPTNSLGASLYQEYLA